jgi:hypothetical protein
VFVEKLQLSILVHGKIGLGHGSGCCGTRLVCDRISQNGRHNDDYGTDDP